MGSFGSDFGFDPSGFLSSLADFFDSVLSAIEDALLWLWNTLVTIVEYLWSVIVYIANFLWNLFGILGTFVKRILVDIIHGNFRDLVQAFYDLQADLKLLFGPILAAIQWLRSHFFQYIYPWIFKALELLQRARAILVFFKLLGFKWAAKLDQDLQAIQSVITKALNDVVKTLNTMSSIIELMVDPGMIIRRDFFAGTLFSSLAAVKRAAGAGGDRALTYDEQQSQQGDKQLINGGAAIAVRNADGSVTYSPAMLQINTNISAALDDYGMLQQ